MDLNKTISIALILILLVAAIYINIFLIKGNDFYTLIARFIIMAVLVAVMVMTFFYYNTMFGF
jgi:hypothetical protein